MAMVRPFVLGLAVIDQDWRRADTSTIQISSGVTKFRN
jgi:hypothetical protein